MLTNNSSVTHASDATGTPTGKAIIPLGDASVTTKDMPFSSQDIMNLEHTYGAHK